MIEVKFRRLGLLAAPALALALLVGCGDDGGPGGEFAAGPTGEAAAALESVVNDFFDSNEEAFNSLATLGPLIGASLGVSPAVAGAGRLSSAVVQSCVSPDIVGKTFEYDFSQNIYIPGQMTGAPAEGVRFLLYELDTSGNPAAPDIGYLDFDCPAQLPTISGSLTVVWNGATILSTTISGFVDVTSGAVSLNMAGSVATPDGGNTLGIDGTIGQGGTFVRSSSWTFNIDPIQEFFAFFGRADHVQGGLTAASGVQMGLSEAFFEWAIDILIGGTPSALDGTVDLADIDGENGLVACVEGTWVSPQFTDASGCAADQAFVDNVTSTQRSSLRTGWLMLRSMWEVLDGIAETGVNIATSAVG